MRFLDLLFDISVLFVNSTLFLTFAWVLVACYAIISIVFMIKYLLRKG